MRTSSSLPKSVVSLSMIIVTLFAFKFNVGYSDDTPPASILVTINNRLSNGEELVVDCKDQNRDLGVQKIPVNQDSIFKFTKLSSNEVYSCSFDWGNESHGFDIFEASRDTGSVFNWNIRESGPCGQADGGATKCYQWN
ncbi:hypothetical protein PIB30_060768 [Stylosanthes scabra]|uniref:S-protein homolog n=1 Tax=Stylosanthes scabra TaxID=79078 RepID=A0ABU6ZJE1_9FABA|nr:hypothetical protein [Stylosanthes scabra]